MSGWVVCYCKHSAVKNLQHVSGKIGAHIPKCGDCVYCFTVEYVEDF